jgi:phosphoglucomutase
MAIQAVGAASSTPAAALNHTRGPARAAGASPDADAADANTVVGKTTKVNPDGSVTVTITYADGHTKTETTPAALAPAVSAAAAARQRSARGANLDVTV